MTKVSDIQFVNTSLFISFGCPSLYPIECKEDIMKLRILTPFKPTIDEIIRVSIEEQKNKSIINW